MTQETPETSKLHFLNLRITPKYKMLSMDDIDEIEMDTSFIYDEHFVKLWAEYLSGKRKSYLTRFPIAQIDVGVRSRRKDGVLEWSTNAVREHDVQRQLRSLRRGARPTLGLYRGGEGRLICPDDAVSAEAYRLAGVRLVPCQIMEDVPALPNGALTIRTYPPLPGGVLSGIKIRSKPSGLPATLLEGADSSARLAQLANQAHEVAAAVRSFHLGADEPITHWHHILVSVAERVATATDAIRLLLERHAVLEAATIVRLIYEMALTFHLNWIAPHHTGRYLQGVADVGPKGWKMVVEALQSEPTPGTTASIRRTWVEGHERMGNLCSSPNQKANLSPIGVIHDNVYPLLSGVAHQDFGALAAFAGRLSDPDAACNNGIIPTRIDQNPWAQ